MLPCVISSLYSVPGPSSWDTGALWKWEPEGSQVQMAHPIQCPPYTFGAGKEQVIRISRIDQLNRLPRTQHGPWQRGDIRKCLLNEWMNEWMERSSLSTYPPPWLKWVRLCIAGQLGYMYVFVDRVGERPFLNLYLGSQVSNYSTKWNSARVVWRKNYEIRLLNILHVMGF